MDGHEQDGHLPFNMVVVSLELRHETLPLKALLLQRIDFVCKICNDETGLSPRSVFFLQLITIDPGAFGRVLEGMARNGMPRPGGCFVVMLLVVVGVAMSVIAMTD